MKWTFASILIMIGVIFGLPHLVGMVKNHPYVSNVVVDVPPYSFDENHYAVRIQKLANGNFNADAYTYEYRHGPWIFSLASTSLLGLVSRLLGSVQNTFIVGDFVLPPLLLVSLYLLIKRFIPSAIFALLGSLVIILEDQFVGFFKAALLSIRQVAVSPFIDHLNNIVSPPFYSRLENPELTGIFFFLSLWGLVSLSRSKVSKSVLFLISLTILFLIYSYPFYSIFLLIVLVSLVGVSIFERRFDRGLLSCLSIVLVGSVPYLLELKKFYTLPVAPDFSLRAGQEAMLTPIPVSAWVVFGILLLLLYKRRNHSSMFLALSLGAVMASMLVFRVQTNHFISRILVPVLRIAEFYLAYLIVRKTPRYIAHRKKQLLLTASLFIILGLSFFHAWFYTQNMVKAFTLPSDVYASYTWVKDHIPAQSVVLSYSIHTNFQLPAFADVYMFLPYTAFSFIPTDEVSKRLTLAYQCIGATDRLPEVIGVSTNPGGRWKPNAREIETKGGFIYYVDRAKKAQGYGFTPEEITNLSRPYQNLPCRQLSDLRQIYKYKIDYLYWGPFEKEHYILPPAALTKVFDTQEVSIYKVE